MRVDECGLGDWWPHPDRAAAGALDHLPADQWPVLAARWLAAGHDSLLLRQLAGLPARDVRTAMEALDLMPEVMRSIGFDPAPADRAFEARCQAAMDVVQRDLDVTGYGRYQIRACIGRGWPAVVFATLPDGSYWGGGEGISRETTGPLLLCSAAGSVSDVLKEIPEIEWPVCAVHGGHPHTDIWDGEEPAVLIGEAAWWQCTSTGHPLAPVGQLTAELTRAP